MLKDNVLVSAIRASGKGYIRSSGSSNKLSDVFFFPPGPPRTEKRNEMESAIRRMREAAAAVRVYRTGTHARSLLSDFAERTHCK